MKNLVFIFILTFSFSSFATKPCESTKSDTGCTLTGVRNYGFPSTKIQNLIKLIKSVDKNMTGSKKKRLMSELDNYFDFKFMAKAALQSKWKTLSSNQQTEYSGFFEKMLKTSYIKKLYKHKKFKIKITGEKLKGKRARVTINLKKKNASNDVPVEIMYKMRKSSKGWVIYDVITDEVSLVKNYRSLFKRIMKNKGFVGLISHLKKHSK